MINRSTKQKEMLRFITCGSVDDGKSTLLGRLLYDSKLILEDQLNSLQKDSKKFGTQENNLDFALLLDGLQSEREQGITIDVAYRFFSTNRRKFIVADTPGHEQYTRNMATGASTAELAIILIDAKSGLKEQTKRHTCIMYLLGIKHIIVAINKMDQISFSQEEFNKIKNEYLNFQEELSKNNTQLFNDITSTHFIPLSALNGDNLVTPSKHTPWYTGKTLMQLLEEIEVDKEEDTETFCLPVQWVNRSSSHFRGFTGTITSGQISKGDNILILPSKKYSKIKNIFLPSLKEAKTTQAFKKMPITLELEDEIDISRGDTIVSTNSDIQSSSEITATLIWMNENDLSTNSSYLIKHLNSTQPVSIKSINYKLNIQTLEQVQTNSLKLNEIGLCQLNTTKPLAFQPYLKNRELGSFILIDKHTNATLAAGMINSKNKNSPNDIFWHQHTVKKEDRAQQKAQKPFVLWFTGLSGSGKSSIANALEKKLYQMHKHTYLLDGDNIRHGLNQDLEFSLKDRDENIRRIAHISKLFVDAGTIVISAFISPLKKHRDLVKNLLEENEFIEVFVDTPLEVCEKRDNKGLYQLAREGKIKDFTGINSPYEAPTLANIHITQMSIDEAVDKVIEYLLKKGLI